MTAPSPDQMRAIADQIVAPWPANVLTKTERESSAALRGGADVIELLMQQRDALAEVAGIEPEWTEEDV